jgi:hypothetical protein
VETIPLHAGAADLCGQRNQLGHGWLTAMEARVEAGHLWHAGKALEHRLDRGQVMRLMQRGQGNQLAQLLQDLRRDERGPRVSGPAMHDSMADAEQARSAVVRSEPGGQRRESAPPVARARLRPIDEAIARAVLGGESRRCPNAFNLPPGRQTPGAGLRSMVDAELHAGRAGVED